jgi:hypothetical protein
MVNVYKFSNEAAVQTLAHIISLYLYNVCVLLKLESQLRNSSTIQI